MDLNCSTNTSSLKGITEDKIIVQLIEVYNSEYVIFKMEAKNEEHEVETELGRKKLENISQPVA